MGQRDFLIVSTTGRLLGTILLTIGGALFRDARYVAFFSLAGVSLVLVLLTMIYRQTIEGWFRRMRASQRLKLHRDRKNEKKKADA
jgi:uncharacterized membrane protein YdjX (TVP38/TMEM64 family)